MKTMFAITHVGKDGMRTLSFGNQGRNHYDTRDAAHKALADFLDNNKPAVLRALYKTDPKTFEVRPVECYDHGDAVGIYFDS